MKESRFIIVLIALLTSVSIIKLVNIEPINPAESLSPLMGPEVLQIFNDYLIEYKKNYTPQEKLYRLKIFH